MDEFPTDTRLYSIMSTNATESLQEAVASERQNRRPPEETPQEKEDREYREWEEQQKQLYQDRPAEETPAEPTFDDVNLEDLSFDSPNDFGAPPVKEESQSNGFASPFDSPFGTPDEKPAAPAAPDKPEPKKDENVKLNEFGFPDMFGDGSSSDNKKDNDPFSSFFK